MVSLRFSPFLYSMRLQYCTYTLSTGNINQPIKQVIKIKRLKAEFTHKLSASKFFINVPTQLLNCSTVSSFFFFFLFLSHNIHLSVWRTFSLYSFNFCKYNYTYICILPSQRHLFFLYIVKNVFAFDLANNKIICLENNDAKSIFVIPTNHYTHMHKHGVSNICTLSMELTNYMHSYNNREVVYVHG